jgi:glycosyltransferase involved in cell wall biosynthesis
MVLAVGPLLRDVATEFVGQSKSVHMLIPGLAEIDAQDAPTTFVAFLSARLSDDAARIKQGHLGIAAFATAQRDAREDGRPDSLRNQPKLILRGVDLEGLVSPTDPDDNTELRLKQFAEKYAHAVVNLHTLPFTEARTELYEELARSSVCLMPSWHEGFGLAAWEAIAAGVPVILSRNSGVYKLLDEKYPAGPGCVYPIEIGGMFSEPFFTNDDLTITTKVLKTVADDPRKRVNEPACSEIWLESALGLPVRVMPPRRSDGISKKELFRSLHQKFARRKHLRLRQEGNITRW